MSDEDAYTGTKGYEKRERRKMGFLLMGSGKICQRLVRQEIKKKGKRKRAGYARLFFL